MFTAKPTQAIGIASAKWIGTGAKIRLTIVADQDPDHREDDRAGEACKVAELAGAEREAWIVGVLAGVGIRERREQERARMRAHLQAIGDERD